MPTTFHGTSSGNAMVTRQTGTPMPDFGILSAIKMPSGISIDRMMPENRRLRPSAFQKRSEARISSNHWVPAQKN
ncbi:hypothetical protein D3C71_1592780 [compost metagenome]